MLLKRFISPAVGVGLLLAFLIPAISFGESEYDTFHYADGRKEEGTLQRQVLDYYVVKTPAGKTLRIDKTELAKIVRKNGEVIQVGGTARSKKKIAPPPLPPKPQPTQVEEKVGFASISSKPSGAGIEIDGENKGKSPAKYLRLTQGEHTIVLSMDNYISQEKVVKIKEGATERMVFKLKPSADTVKLGYLSVKSTPDQALVIVDGMEKGFTPAKKMELRAGVHAVLVSKEGYESEEKVVTVVNKKTQKLTLKLKLIPEKVAKPEPKKKATGKLNVITHPSGANVLVDSIDKGRSPMTGIQVDEGTHTVAVALEGHFGQEKKVKIKKGKLRNVEFKLKPMPAKKEELVEKPAPAPAPSPVVETGSPGLLSVSSKPAGAELRIDGIVRGRTPRQEMEVAPGSHWVSVSLADYVNQEKSIEVTTGKKQRVSFELSKVLESPKETAEDKAKTKKRSTGKRVVRLTSAVTALGVFQGAAYYHNRVVKKYDEYSSATDSDQLKKLHSEIRTAENLRNVLLLIGGAGGASFVFTFVF